MYEVIYSQRFKKQLKRLSRKNARLEEELDIVLRHFEKSNAIAIGKSIFKLRLKGWHRGKSGGYRLYVYVIEIHNVVTPIFIYPKNERENIILKKLMYYLEEIEIEIYLTQGWIEF